MIETKNILNLIAAIGGLGIAATASAAPVALDTFAAFGTGPAGFSGASDSGFTLGNGTDSFDGSSGGVATLTDGPITLAVGDLLTLTFNLSVPVGILTPSSSERGFRFGFVNEAANDTTLVGALDVGPAVGGTTMRVLNNAGTGNIFSSGNQLAGGPGNGGAITQGANLTMSLTIERVAGPSVYDITVNWNGVTLFADDVTVDGNAPGPGVFDAVAIIFNSPDVEAASQAVISNVVADYTPVPEPGALALTAVGVLMLFRRRSA